MTDAVELSRLIDGIYDCVLDRSRWSNVFEQLCPRLGAHVAVYRQAPTLLIQHGVEPQLWATYLTQYARGNPWSEAALLYLQEGDLRALYRTVDVAAFQQTRYYTDWLAPQGWGDSIAGMLSRSSASFAFIAMIRPAEDGPFGDEELMLMRLLLPHARKAAKLGWIFDDQAARLSGMAAFVERIKGAAFLVEGSGRIAYANAATGPLLAEGGLVRERGGMLVPLDGDLRAALRAAFSGRKKTPFIKAISHAQGMRILAVVPPSAESGGYAIVLVSAPEADLPLPGPILMEAYGLTAAEIRVLVGLIKGRPLAEMARDFGVAQRTVKAHLQKIFAKTGTRRQTDLIRQVLSLAPPMLLS
ncbi:MAG: helix-turn-helix transcriptional regulator [Rhizomicrobium sp.]